MESCFSSSELVSPTARDWLTSSTLQIRTAQKSDLKALSEILTLCFHSFDGWRYWLYPLFKLGVYEDLRVRLRSPAPYYQCLVAVAGEGAEIVGMVEVSWPIRPLAGGSLGSHLGGNPVPYLANLAVKPSHQRQGIARQLLLKCEQIALHWGSQQLTLHVLENNYPARQLYLASGYLFHRWESSWSGWLWQTPRRLLMYKPLSANKLGTEVC